MPETFNPVVLLTVQRVKERAAAAKAEWALAKLGAPVREDRAPRVKRRRMAPLTAEQRAAAYKAKRGPLGWFFAGSSAEDVIADSSFLKKIHHIYKVRPYMRSSGRCTIHLPSGKSVKFDTRRGEVIRP